MRLLVSAGEVSGDQRLRALLNSLKSIVGSVEAYGMGPEDCVHNLVERGDISMMGFDRVLTVGARLWNARKILLQWSRTQQPDMAILVDYGGFNMRLGRQLRSMGIPVVYYVPPKLWAWGAHRARRLHQSADLFVPVFEFAQQWFDQRGFPTFYAGHPAQQDFVSTQGDQDVRGNNLLLLPGSRPGEIARHLPVFLEAVAHKDIQSRFDEITLAVAGRHLRPMVDALLSTSNASIRCVEVRGGSDLHDLMRSCRFGWMASGTVNLEAAWSGLDGLVVYKTTTLTYMLARRLITVPWISPVNLVANAQIYPELIQHQCTAEAIVGSTMTQLANDRSQLLQQSFAPQSGITDQIADYLINWLGSVRGRQ